MQSDGCEEDRHLEGIPEAAETPSVDSDLSAVIEASGQPRLCQCGRPAGHRGRHIGSKVGMRCPKVWREMFEASRYLFGDDNGIRACGVLLAGLFTRDLGTIARWLKTPVPLVKEFAFRYEAAEIWNKNGSVYLGRVGDEEVGDVELALLTMVGTGEVELMGKGDDALYRAVA
jgi:hypothetical protein